MQTQLHTATLTQHTATIAEKTSEVHTLEARVDNLQVKLTYLEQIRKGVAELFKIPLEGTDACTAGAGVEALQKLHSDLISRVQELTTHSNGLISRVQELTTHSNGLASALAASETSIPLLRDSLRQAQTAFATLETTYQAQQDRFVELRTAHTAVIVEVGVLRDELAVLRQQQIPVPLEAVSVAHETTLATLATQIAVHTTLKGQFDLVCNRFALILRGQPGAIHQEDSEGQISVALEQDQVSHPGYSFLNPDIHFCTSDIHFYTPNIHFCAPDIHFL